MFLTELKNERRQETSAYRSMGFPSSSVLEHRKFNIQRKDTKDTHPSISIGGHKDEHCSWKGISKKKKQQK